MCGKPSHQHLVHWVQSVAWALCSSQSFPRFGQSVQVTLLCFLQCNMRRLRVLVLFCCVSAFHSDLHPGFLSGWKDDQSLTWEELRQDCPLLNLKSAQSATSSYLNFKDLVIFMSSPCQNLQLVHTCSPLRKSHSDSILRVPFLLSVKSKLLYLFYRRKTF